MATKLENPMITTLTAELNVVKIGNKQMTISVFNQIIITEEEKEEDYLYEKDYTGIKYQVWGRIFRNDIWYILYQFGKELRKTYPPFIYRYDDINTLQQAIKKNKNNIELINKESNKYNANDDFFKNMYFFIKERNYSKQYLKDGYFKRIMDEFEHVQEEYDYLKSERLRIIELQKKVKEKIDSTPQIYIAV